MRDKIRQAVNQALKDLGQKPVKYQIEHPGDMAHGDYAVNVAMVLGGGRPLAEKIAAKLHESNLKNIVSEIKVEGPGFINISIQNNGLITLVDKMLSGSLYQGQLKGQKIMVEYTDPNPFKEMHIGHLYSNIVGESICRLFEAVGGEVKRVCYQGDVG